MVGRHVHRHLAAYVEGQLEAADQARVAAHLRECERCRTALDEVRRGIALASELGPESMPGPVAERIRHEILHGSRRRVPLPAWFRTAAAVLIVLAGVGVFWQANRPWAALRRAPGEPTRFEQQGRELHDRLQRGDVRLAYQTSGEHEAWQWLSSQRAPVTDLRPNRDGAEAARFVPEGALVTTLAGARTSVVAYRIDGRPATLMLARAESVADAPRPGWWSKQILHRRDDRGVNSLTWTVGGGTYVLVSELDGLGQQACFICHTDARFRQAIETLSLPEP